MRAPLLACEEERPHQALTPPRPGNLLLLSHPQQTLFLRPLGSVATTNRLLTAEKVSLSHLLRRPWVSCTSCWKLEGHPGNPRTMRSHSMTSLLVSPFPAWGSQPQSPVGHGFHASPPTQHLLVRPQPPNGAQTGCAVLSVLQLVPASLCEITARMSL